MRENPYRSAQRRLDHGPRNQEAADPYSSSTDPSMKSATASLFVSLALASGLPLTQAAQFGQPDVFRPETPRKQPTESRKPQQPEVRNLDSEVRRSESRSNLSMSADYLLQPQDLLRIQVYQEEDINRQGEVSISQQYTIFLPLVGMVDLKGKTARQAERMIRDLYDKDFLVNPQISVTVMKYAERSVNVFGAVNNAGRKPFPPERGLTILDAISLAGGHNRFADLKKVKLTRNGTDGEPVTITVNVDEIMKGGGKDPGPIQPDDAVFVGERIL